MILPCHDADAPLQPHAVRLPGHGHRGDDSVLLRGGDRHSPGAARRNGHAHPLPERCGSDPHLHLAAIGRADDHTDTDGFTDGLHPAHGYLHLHPAAHPHTHAYGHFYARPDSDDRADLHRCANGHASSRTDRYGDTGIEAVSDQLHLHLRRSAAQVQVSAVSR